MQEEYIKSIKKKITMGRKKSKNILYVTRNAKHFISVMQSIDKPKLSFNSLNSKKGVGAAPFSLFYEGFFVWFLLALYTWFYCIK